MLEIKIFRTPEEQEAGVHLENFKPYGRLPVNKVYFFPHVGDSAQVVSKDIPEDLTVYFLSRDLRVLQRVLSFGPGALFTPRGTVHVVETSARAPEITDFGFLWPHLQ